MHWPRTGNVGEDSQFLQYLLKFLRIRRRNWRAGSIHDCPFFYFAVTNVCRVGSKQNRQKKLSSLDFWVPLVNTVWILISWTNFLGHTWQILDRNFFMSQDYKFSDSFKIFYSGKTTKNNEINALGFLILVRGHNIKII